MNFQLILLRGGAALLLLGLFAGTSEAVLIDNFATSQGPVADGVNGGGAATNSLGGPIATSIIGAGGSRSLGVEKTNAAAGSAQLEITSNQVLYQTPAGMTGQFAVNYFPASPLNLSGDSSITISGFGDASAGGSSIGVLFQDNDSIDSEVVVLAPNANFNATFLFSSFTGINFSQISSISIGTFNGAGNLVNSTAGADINIYPPFFTSNNAVPEPVSVAVWSLFAMAAAAFAWRRKKR